MGGTSDSSDVLTTNKHLLGVSAYYQAKDIVSNILVRLSSSSWLHAVLLCWQVVTTTLSLVNPQT